jgi:WD40 repeat protein
MATTPPSQPTPESDGIHIGDVGGSVNFSALGDIVGGDKITTITTTIQISVEAITQRPLITSSPYRGLDRFEDRDKDLFFGRDQLIKSLLTQLSASNVLLVLGASGSGKSSVVRAGLLPQLAQLIGARFRYFTFVPDVNPFESLRATLLAAGFSQTQTRELADAKAETPAKLIHALQRDGDQWLFFVDQFEEMFTVGDEKLRAGFIEALVAIAQDPNSSTKLVLAMRADFLDRFSPFPQFAKIIEKNIDFVADMHIDELRQAIEQPAARHGVVFEQGLVEEIIKDVQGQAGSLPLLQYTLDLLWQEEAREDALADRHLNARAYRELGGVRGALQKRADEIYAFFGDGSDAKAATPKQEIVRQIFLRLVDLAGEGSNDAAWRPVRRRASMTMFTAAQEEEILQALINQKLLVSNREGDDATVEVAHEALFTSWGRLKNWIDAGKQVIFARNRLADDARRWQRRQQESDAGADEELLGGSRLAQAIDMRGRGDFVTVVGGLGEIETQFLDASLALRDRRAQEEQLRQQRELEAAQRLAEARTLAAGRLRKGLAIAIVLALFAIAGGALALLQSRKASEQERKAKDETSRSEYLRASTLLDTGDADEALRSIVRALEANPSDREVATRLLNLLGQRQWPHLLATENHQYPVKFLQTNSDGSRIFVTTVSANVWMEQFGSKRAQLSLHDGMTLGPIKTMDLDSVPTRDPISVSGKRLLLRGLLIDTDTGAKAEFSDLPEDVLSASPDRGWSADVGFTRFSSNGEWVLLCPVNKEGEAKTLEIRSATDGQLHPGLPRIALQGEILDASMGDQEVSVLAGDGNVTIHSLAGSAPSNPRKILTEKQIEHLALAKFDSQGRTLLALSGSDMTLWDLSRPLKTLSEQTVVGGETGGIPIQPNGLAMFASETSWILSNDTLAVLFDAAGFTVAGHDFHRSPDKVRSFATEVRFGAGEEKPELVTDWKSSFAPVCVITQGLAVARDNKALVLPFHGGSFSGPLRHDSQVTAICDLKGGRLATGATSGKVRLWRLTLPAYSPALENRATAKDPRGYNRKNGVEIWIEQEKGSDQVMVRRGGADLRVELSDGLKISGVELAADGKRGVIRAERNTRGGPRVEAWMFSTDDGKLLVDFLSPDRSQSAPNCDWIGFDRDGKCVLTIDEKSGQMFFWNQGPEAESGQLTFKRTGPILPQAGMVSAVFAERGNRMVTWSSHAEAIVWDTVSWKPLRWLSRDPLWSVPEKSECAPALSSDGRRLATAYGKAFVIWDVENGKPLSDPIFCTGMIERLAFLDGGPARVRATLSDGNVLTWDYADLIGVLVDSDIRVLGQLASAIADDKWVDEAPKLVGNGRHEAVVKLVKHFAQQASVIREKAPAMAPRPSPSK